MMKGRSPKGTGQPTMMIHHVREIQFRLLAVASVLVIGMIVGYMYYEPLFEFIKAPLNGPLHYMSPAGSFTFIIKICLMIGVIVTLPVAVYNAIMFVQPALSKRLSKARVYLTTLASLLLAGAGASFGFLIILPLALHFFYKFQVDGLVAIISADEYLRFVVSIIITFVLMFQLPLLISFIDHITPLQPKKLLKIEKYIVVGSIFIGVIVPFALDPTVQLLIASPIIVLYNLSILVVMIQQYARRRRAKKESTSEAADASEVFESRKQPSHEAPAPALEPLSPQLRTLHSHAASVATKPVSAPRYKSLDGTVRPSVNRLSQVERKDMTLGSPRNTIVPKIVNSQLPRPGRSMSDIRLTQPRSRIVSSPRPTPLMRRQIIE